MKYTVAPVKNIQRLNSASRSLVERAHGVPGIGVLWAPTGYGKTTAAAWMANQIDALYVRATATWTPSSMLGAIMRELQAEPRQRCADMLDHIVQDLAINTRPVLVDEADYLVDKKALVETLRDIHDLSSAPLWLIGMADFRRKVTHREQLQGRVAQWIEFRAADIEDARTLADAVCEVHISDDLLVSLHTASAGSMRAMTVGIYHIETLARRRGLDRISAKDWGKQSFVFRADAA